MTLPHARIRSAVRRDRAEEYLLTTQVAFGVTVIAVRVFLQLTGFPQLGNDVLHIAHALWGGLLLFLAVLLPLALANRWALTASAWLSGIGIGLFIDEVGKFITQANDYFFPPALSLIYGFFLLTGFLYLHFRRPHRPNPRKAMYHALEGLQDALDADLDPAEAARIEGHLAVARQSDREEIVSLASAIGGYLGEEERHRAVAEPDLWERTSARLDALGRRLGRRRHRAAISLLLIVWVALVIGYVAVLVPGGPDLDPQVLRWRTALLAIQTIVGGLMLGAALSWLAGNEERGLGLAVSSLLLSLVALQTLYFYLSQFSAVTSTLLQVAFLQVLLAYRRWYLREPASLRSS